MAAPERRTPAVVIRIDRSDHRRVCECQSYAVERRADGRTLIYTYDTEERTEEPTGVIALEPDEVGYVMAAQTRASIEIIRPGVRPAELKVTTP